MGRFAEAWRFSALQSAANKNPAAPQPDFYHGNELVVLQQVALPQRALLIFSRRLSTPTAPTTTCLPIT